MGYYDDAQKELSSGSTWVRKLLGLPEIKGYNIPDPSKKSYDTQYGVPKEYRDRASRFHRLQRENLKKSEEQLKRMGAYARGEKSRARQVGAEQERLQKAQLASAAQGAQRGGRSAAAQRGAQYQQEATGRDIEAQTGIAAQLERQKAAQAYAKAAQAQAQQRLDMEKIGRGYHQLGLQDKQKMAQYRQMMDKLYGAKRAKLAEYGLKESEDDIGFWASIAGAAGDLINAII